MKQHPIYPQYTISKDGQVWKNGKLSSPQSHVRGYIKVWISDVNACRFVHRLVAETYIPNPDNLPQINHIDRDKTNNNVSNLEWCDAQRNAEHSNSVVRKLKTPSGETIEVHNLTRWCRENNVPHSSLYKGLCPRGYHLL